MATRSDQRTRYQPSLVQQDYDDFGSIDALLLHRLADHRKFLADRACAGPNGIRFSPRDDGRSSLRDEPDTEWEDD